MMDVKTKTKDTEASRLDLEIHTYRSGLYLTTVGGKPAKPKASYTLTKKDQMEVRNWLKTLKLPDGYASNLSRFAGIYIILLT